MSRRICIISSFTIVFPRPHIELNSPSDAFGDAKSRNNFVHRAKLPSREADLVPINRFPCFSMCHRTAVATVEFTALSSPSRHYIPLRFITHVQHNIFCAESAAKTKKNLDELSVRIKRLKKCGRQLLFPKH